MSAHVNSKSHDIVNRLNFYTSLSEAHTILCEWILSQDDKKLEEDSVNKRRRKGNNYLSEVCSAGGLKYKTSQF